MFRDIKLTFKAKDFQPSRHLNVIWGNGLPAIANTMLISIFAALTLTNRKHAESKHILWLGNRHFLKYYFSLKVKRN